MEDQLGPLSQEESDLKKVRSTGNAVDSVQIGRSGSMGVVPIPPVTPKMTGSKLHSRNASFTMGGNEGPNASPFSNNDFMTVTCPTSPSGKGKETAGEASVIKNDTSTSLSSTLGGKKRKAADHHIEGGHRRRTRRRR